MSVNGAAVAGGRRLEARSPRPGGGEVQAHVGQVAPSWKAVLYAGPAACGYADQWLDAGPGRRAAWQRGFFGWSTSGVTAGVLHRAGLGVQVRGPAGRRAR